MRVQILVSTYNGAALLGQQLASLVEQTASDQIEIIIRDDGSSDETGQIARDFAAAWPRVSVHEGENVGVIASFGELLQLADPTADAFFWCDQDDVWLPDKVATAVAALTPHLDSAEPALYCCRSLVTDVNLVGIGETNEQPRGPSFRHALVQTIAPGHTMAMNRALLTLLREHYPADRILMHDSWAYLVASAFGVVIFDRSVHCLYRTHTTNALGYEVGRWVKLKGRVRRILGQDRSAYTRQVAALCDEFGTELEVDDRAAATGFAYSQRSLANRLGYLRRFPIVHETPVTTFVANALYLVGRYRARDLP